MRPQRGSAGSPAVVSSTVRSRRFSPRIRSPAGRIPGGRPRRRRPRVEPRACDLERELASGAARRRRRRCARSSRRSAQTDFLLRHSHTDVGSRSLSPLRRDRHAHRRAVDDAPEHAGATGAACGCCRPSSCAIGLSDVLAGRARLPDGDDSGHVGRDGARHRFHRARGHVAGDAGDRRPSDRPPGATTDATSFCRTIPSAVLRAAKDPDLAAQIGHDIVTASGLTLLGADDKAGVAAIVAAAELPDAAIRRFRTGRFASASRRTRRSDAARITSTSRDSARCAPIRSTAARAASSSTRASRPTR